MIHDLDENPFIKHGALLRGTSGADLAIQALVRHLFCAADWPCDVSKVLRDYGPDVATVGLEIQAWYAQHGERDQVFLEVARSLAIAANEAQARYEDRQTNGCQNSLDYGDSVCGEPVTLTCVCGARLCRECANDTESHSRRGGGVHWIDDDEAGEFKADDPR